MKLTSTLLLAALTATSTIACSGSDEGDGDMMNDADMMGDGDASSGGSTSSGGSVGGDGDASSGGSTSDGSGGTPGDSDGSGGTSGTSDGATSDAICTIQIACGYQLADQTSCAQLFDAFFDQSQIDTCHQCLLDNPDCDTQMDACGMSACSAL